MTQFVLEHFPTIGIIVRLAIKYREVLTLF